MNESINGWLAVARGVHLAACLMLLGVWVFDRWIIAGAGRQIAMRSRRNGIWLTAISLSAALLSGIAWYYFVADAMKDADEPMRLPLLALVLRSTKFGRVWQLRAALLVAVIILFPPLASLGSARKNASCPGTREKVIGWLAGAVAVVLVASLAWAGHGATGPAHTWHRTADVIHLLVCAIWPIGLIPLALLLWQFKRQRQPMPAALLRRFSTTATIAVAMLVASGIVNSWCLVGSFPALWNTLYGRVLLAKLAIFLATLILGAVNFRRVRSNSASGQLTWLVSIEAGLGLGILAIVGILGLLMPARM